MNHLDIMALLVESLDDVLMDAKNLEAGITPFMEAASAGFECALYDSAGNRIVASQALLDTLGFTKEEWESYSAPPCVWNKKIRTITETQFVTLRPSLYCLNKAGEPVYYNVLVFPLDYGWFTLFGVQTKPPCVHGEANARRPDAALLEPN